MNEWKWNIIKLCDHAKYYSMTTLSDDVSSMTDSALCLHRHYEPNRAKSAFFNLHIDWHRFWLAAKFGWGPFCYYWWLEIVTSGDFEFV